MADKTDLKQIHTFPAFWASVWQSLSTKGDVSIKENWIKFKNPKENLDKLPGWQGLQNTFWICQTGSKKMKDNHWDWWGDTSVTVYEIVGPKSIEEVLN